MRATARKGGRKNAETPGKANSNLQSTFAAIPTSTATNPLADLPSPDEKTMSTVKSSASEGFWRVFPVILDRAEVKWARLNANPDMSTVFKWLSDAYETTAYDQSQYMKSVDDELASSAKKALGELGKVDLANQATARAAIRAIVQSHPPQFMPAKSPLNIQPGPQTPADHTQLLAAVSPTFLPEQPSLHCGSDHGGIR